MRVLHIDDHPLFIEGLRIAIEAKNIQSEPITLLPALTFESAVEQLNNSAIDLILLDLTLENIDGLTLFQRLSEQAPLTPIIALSASESIYVIHSIITAGALGFIPKTLSINEVVAAIEFAMNGNIYLPQTIREQLEQLNQYNLSCRHMELLPLITGGLSNQDIAETLFISTNTVKTHLKILFSTLGVSSRIECIEKAKSLGFIE